jgi:hypothetical protein
MDWPAAHPPPFYQLATSKTQLQRGSCTLAKESMHAIIPQESLQEIAGNSL